MLRYLKDTHLNDQSQVLLHGRSDNKLGMMYLFERLSWKLNIPVVLHASTLTTYMPVYVKITCQCILKLHAGLFLFPYLKDTHLNNQIPVLLHANTC